MLDTRFHWVLMDLSGFSWDLLSFNTSYWVILCYLVYKYFTG